MKNKFVLFPFLILLLFVFIRCNIEPNYLCPIQNLLLSREDFNNNWIKESEITSPLKDEPKRSAFRRLTFGDSRALQYVFEYISTDRAKVRYSQMRDATFEYKNPMNIPNGSWDRAAIIFKSSVFNETEIACGLIQGSSACAFIGRKNAFVTLFVMYTDTYGFSKETFNQALHIFDTKTSRCYQ
jgi:hypothetical protein